ncbi:hypothetical protein OLMES_1013 [Oleiphilus messinensis]|uniref:Uncharacterized protein n=1 Tax=Oleiphilus messinensis TaxID=141451 RepID=A0A1Y0I4H0_9GAMM|nr:hypothetical protein [Oleiphilus messinensis]ARU55099.1 hypothetical protein OLMES_1013 [Oleiphilus messinensis]
MQISENALTNHEVTICLKGGAVLGPYNATWSKENPGDIRELVKEYERFLQGEPQQRYKFHLHDTYSNNVHTIYVHFDNVAGICDQVKTRS